MRQVGPSAAIVAVALALALAAGATAQTQTGSIVGVVTASDGKPLPGVTVTLSGSGVMGSRSVVSGENGAYRFTALIPADDYAVSFELEGLRRSAREGIHVSGGQTVTLDIALEMEGVAEEINVQASPMVDVTSVTAATTQGEELLENIPNARNFQDAVSQSPSLTGGGETGTWSSKGGAATSNEVAFDGVPNTSPVYHTVTQDIVYESTNEVQVVTGGLPAELGNVGGAFVNVITKSGGNQFHGEAAAYYQDDSLQSDNVDSDLKELGIEQASQIVDFDDQALNVGGPILRDKVWFNLGYRNYNQTLSTAGFPQDNEDARDYYLGKVTFQPTQRHNFFVMYNRNENEIQFNPADEFNAPEATWFTPETAEVAKAKWTAVLSDSLFLEADVATADNETGLLPQSDAGESYFHLATSSWTGGAFIYQVNETKRRQASIALPWFMDIGDSSHDFKAGVQYEKNNWYGDNFKPFSPVLYHYMLNDIPEALEINLVAISNYPSQTNNESEGLHAFIQDGWRFNDRVTLNLGVRLNTWEGSYPPQGNPGREYGPFVDLPPVQTNGDTVIDWDSFEPRLGATISLDDDGDSVLRVAASRYHHGLYFGYMILGNPNALAYNLNLWIDFDGDLFADIPEVLTLIAAGGGPSASVDRDVRNPLTDEFLVGFEQQLFQDFALAVNATYREDDDIIEVIKPGLGPESFAPRVVVDPGPDGVTGNGDDGTLTVFNQVSGFGVGQLITNPDRATREYKGVELIARRRLRDDWQALASLVWQEGTGTAGTDFEASKGWSLDFDDPNKLINADGPLTQDREWQLKVMGSYMAPLGFIFSGYWEYMTGLPLYRTLTVTLDQGPVAVYADPKDAHTLEDQSRLNLRVEKVFGFGDGPIELGIIADAFNVLNEDAVTSEVGSTNTAGGFGRPVTIQAPRTLRLGARVRF
jgi:hypothetical protein